MKTPRVAILVAGIMGSSTALLLARRGAAVTLFDALRQPLAAASRWNEGKIHLGFLYSADRSLQTARRILPGGLAFKPLVEELIGCSLGQATTSADDIYLCHIKSVVEPDAMQGYFEKVANIVREHPEAGRYFVDVSDCRIERLSARELNSLCYRPDIVAGFRIPERSVSTTWVADRFIEALSAERLIEQTMETRVTGIRPATAVGMDGRWFVETPEGARGPFDFVINSLWEGRLAVDVTAGLRPIGEWSHRFRLSLFVRTNDVVDVPSVVIATGPFGDVKNYNGRDFYLSWYPKGLIAENSEIMPPEPPLLDETSQREIRCSILEKLEELLPSVSLLRDRLEQATLAGGWVFAAGRGSLSDKHATLHRRFAFGIRRMGSYISVDTGKYSTAPWLARMIANSIVPD
jgi:hypothetical protein